MPLTYRVYSNGTFEIYEYEFKDVEVCRHCGSHIKIEDELWVCGEGGYCRRSPVWPKRHIPISEQPLIQTGDNVMAKYSVEFTPAELKAVEAVLAIAIADDTLWTGKADGVFDGHQFNAACRAVKKITTVIETMPGYGESE